MQMSNRVSRTLLFGAALALPALLFVLGLRSGGMLFVLMAALSVIALVVWRVFAVNGATWARAIDARITMLGEARATDAGSAQNAGGQDAAPIDAIAESSPHIDATGTRSSMPLGRFPARLSEFVLPSAPRLHGWIGLIALALAVLLPLGLRFYRLNDLQAEQYGDINIVYEYVRDIRLGQWPFRFVLSSGPLYHYLIAPIIALTGLNYAGIKIASVATSIGILICIYLIGRRMYGHRFGLLAFFVTGVSSWLLVFSRLGNSQILVPLLSAIALYLLVRYEQTNRLWAVGACALVSALGFYGYPQSFATPPAFFTALAILLIANRRPALGPLATFVIVTLVIALPFGLYFIESPARFVEGYIGEKVNAAQSPVSAFIGNVGRAFGAFHIRGDSVFRSNPAKLPHLDVASGLLMLIGAVFWLRPGRRRWFAVWMALLLILQLPSMLVLNFPDEVPSASRSLGAAPIVYLLVASGAWALFVAARRWHLTRPATIAGAAVLCASLVGLNAQRYFGDYIAGLPYGNTPIGRIMTDFVDLLPPDTNVYLSGCCWTNGMPEPKTLRYEMRGERQLIDLPAGSLTCETLPSTLQPPAVVMWNHADEFASPALATCPDALPNQLYVSRENKPVFRAATYRPQALRPASGPLTSPLTPPGQDGLLATPEDLGAGVRSIGGLFSVDAYISNRPAVLTHSQLDMGNSFNMVDGDEVTLARGREANPFQLNLSFPEPQRLRRLLIKTQTLTDARVIIAVVGADGTVSEIRQAFQNTEPNPTLTFDLGMEPVNVAVLRVEIVDRRPLPGDGYHMHIYEVAVE